ncbi:TRAPP I complex [Neoconidiobolus thromboides FSU 785]|nr:TRAPP I complex [Neoconidiobolus thromboides FSU 785]
MSNTNQKFSLNSFSFLFSELIQYSQNRVDGIQDLEKKLNEIGKRVGIRALEILTLRGKGGLFSAKREIRVQDLLTFISTILWQFLFDKAVDAFERSTESPEEYMLSDNEPLFIRYISVPKELSQFNANAFVAGIVEGVLQAGQYPCRVTAHSVPAPGFPSRTTILIKLDASILEREAQLNRFK